MTKLEQLLADLCPNGVEYKTLGEIGSVKMCKRVMKNQTSPIGDVPFFKIGTFGKIPDAYISQELFDEYRSKFSYPKKGDVLISCSGTIGRTVVFDGELAYFQDSNIVWLDHDGSVVLNEYLECCYSRKPWKVAEGGIISRLYNENILQTKIPVPPIEIQREIVRILESLSKLTSTLIAELTVEYEARVRQCEYYRDHLLEKNIPAERVMLGDVCEIYDGTHQTPEYTNEGVPFVSVENISDLQNTTKYISSGAYAKFKIKPRCGDVFMTRIGSVGKCAVVQTNDDLAYYVSLALLRPNLAVLNSNYLKHYIESGFGKKELHKRILWTAVPLKINKEDIGKLLIAIPPLEEQERIVSILDRFDALCNDITAGLPAEIEARQKQYEFYRDKLLTFKEIDENGETNHNSSN